MFSGRDSVRAEVPLVTIAGLTVHMQLEDIVALDNGEFYCHLSIIFAYSVYFTPCIRVNKLPN